jgi:cytochrome P450
VIGRQSPNFFPVFFNEVTVPMPKKPSGPFAQPDYKRDPYAVYAQMRAQAPAVLTVLPNGIPVYVVTGYAEVLAGLKDERLVKNVHNARPKDLFSRLGLKPNLNNTNMLRADPPEHTRLRALAHAAFTPKFVNQMRGHVQEIADRLLDAALPKGQMDLIQDYAFPLPITVITEMLGVPTADEARFRQWSGAIIASGVLSNEGTQLVPQMLPLANYVSRLVSARRKAPQDDLISQLLHAEQDGDRFSQNEVIGTTILLLIAGHETTVNLIGNGTLALLQDPEQLARLRQDPSLIKSAVEAILRLVNPVQMVNRYAAVDLEIGGVAIPKGSHVMLAVAAADHDPAFAGTPEALDVAHGDAKHLAFGQGIHYCLGAPLARLEGEIAFTSLLARLPNLRLADPRLAPEWRPALELRGMKALRVVF